jgi:hypothetical protein
MCVFAVHNVAAASDGDLELAFNSAFALWLSKLERFILANFSSHVLSLEQDLIH